LKTAQEDRAAEAVEEVAVEEAQSEKVQLEKLS